MVRLSRRRQQKQLMGLSLASSPSVWWLLTRRRPLVSPCTISSLFSLLQISLLPVYLHVAEKIANQ
ncbi:uncharacterized protein DS421_7g209190 [Arachis hypogaea]|nr:uncharacterized protein DS421_7g209190 [Arachis hypogaea]